MSAFDRLKKNFEVSLLGIPFLDWYYAKIPLLYSGLMGAVGTAGYMLTREPLVLSMSLKMAGVMAPIFYGIEYLTKNSFRGSQLLSRKRLGDTLDLPSLSDVSKRISPVRKTVNALMSYGACTAILATNFNLVTEGVYSAGMLASNMQTHPLGDEFYHGMGGIPMDLAISAGTLFTFSYVTDTLYKILNGTVYDSSKKKRFREDFRDELSYISKGRRSLDRFHSIDSYLLDSIWDDPEMTGASRDGIEFLINNAEKIKESSSTLQSHDILKTIYVLDNKENYAGAFLFSLYYRTIEISEKDSRLADRLIDTYKGKVVDIAVENDNPAFLALLAYYEDKVTGDFSTADTHYSVLLEKLNRSNISSFSFGEGAVGVHAVDMEGSSGSSLSKTIVRKSVPDKDLDKIVDESELSLSLHDALASHDDPFFSHSKPLSLHQEGDRYILTLRQDAGLSLGEFAYRNPSSDATLALYGDIADRIPLLTSLIENNPDVTFSRHDLESQLVDSLVTLSGTSSRDYERFASEVVSLLDECGGPLVPGLDIHESNLLVLSRYFSMDRVSSVEKIDTPNKGLRHAVLDYSNLILSSYRSLRPDLYSKASERVYRSFSSAYDISEPAIASYASELVRAISFSSAWTASNRQKTDQDIAGLLKHTLTTLGTPSSRFDPSDQRDVLDLGYSLLSRVYDHRVRRIAT
ncbi:MAG: hypothetical protein ACOCZV_01210 [Nanoarchaeota archaeon]